MQPLVVVVPVLARVVPPLVAAQPVQVLQALAQRVLVPQVLALEWPAVLRQAVWLWAPLQR